VDYPIAQCIPTTESMPSGRRTCSALRFLLLQLRNGHVDVAAAVLFPLFRLFDLPARHSICLQQSAALMGAESVLTARSRLELQDSGVGKPLIHHRATGRPVSTCYPARKLSARRPCSCWLSLAAPDDGACVLAYQLQQRPEQRVPDRGVLLCKARHAQLSQPPCAGSRPCETTLAYCLAIPYSTSAKHHDLDAAGLLTDQATCHFLALLTRVRRYYDPHSAPIVRMQQCGKGGTHG